MAGHPHPAGPAACRRLFVVFTRRDPPERLLPIRRTIPLAQERWFTIRYVNAEEFLPQNLVDEIRRYFEGGAIYVPRSDGRAGWGTGSGTRAELDERNRAIRREFAEGARTADLAEKYCLSPDSIRKILRES